MLRKLTIRLTICIVAITAVCASLAEGYAEPSLLYEAKTGREGRPIFAEVKLSNKITVTALIDTGAGISVLDASLRDQNSTPHRVVEIASPQGKRRIQTYVAPTMIMGAEEVGPIKEIAFVDLANLRAVTDCDVRGVIGYDLLRDFVLEIDFDAGSIRIWRTPPSEILQGARRLIEEVQDIPHLRFRLPTNKESLMVLDTGANASTFRNALFDECLADGSLQPMGDAASLTIEGRGMEPIGQLAELRLGPFKHSGVIIGRSDLSLVGLSYLSRYRIVLDFPRHAAFLTPSARFRVQDPVATSGMSVLRQGAKKIVASVAPQGPSAAAGIVPKDEIVSVNGKSAAKLDLFEMREIFTSAPNEILNVTLRRANQEYSCQLKLIHRRDLAVAASSE